MPNRLGYFIDAVTIPATLFVISVIGILITVLIRYFWRKRRRHIKRQNIQDEDKHTSTPLLSDEEIEEDHKPIVEIKQKVERLVGLLLFFVALGVLSLSVIGFTANAFDYLRIEIAIPVITVILWTWWIIVLVKFTSVSQKDMNEVYHSLFRDVPDLHATPIRKFFQRLKRAAKHRPKTLFPGLVFLFLFAFCGCFFTEGICISEYPTTYSTRFTRKLETSLCLGPSPCFVYLTFPERAYSSIIVNFHTSETNLHGSDGPMIYFDTKSHGNSNKLDDYANKLSASSYLYESLDIKRMINWVEIIDLEPNTTYYFRVGYGSEFSSYSAEKRFLTFPENGPIRFVAGGDIGLTDHARAIGSHAASFSPLFAMIGGDIPYANAMSSCYRIWDKWLEMWQEIMVTPAGNMIPIIASIGNHEAGYNIEPENVPFFLKYFPQQTNSNTNPNLRSTYHAHQISESTVLFVLDTNIVSSSDGLQKSWLKEQLSEIFSKIPNKMALYHVPQWASSLDYDSYNSKKLRADWGNLFDDYHMNVAWENHDHVYSRSYPIKDNEINKNGTQYLGAGAWGVDVSTTMNKTAAWWQERFEFKNFVFLVELREDESTMSIDAIDVQGDKFDHVDCPF